MEIIGCGKGHYYNPELYSSCPECAKERGNIDFVGATEFVGHGNYLSSDNDIGTTEAVTPGKYPDNISAITESKALDRDGYVNNGNSIGETEALPGLNPQILNTSDLNRTPGKNLVDDFGPTGIIGSQNPPVNKGIPFLPVVGWLVCVDGPAKGRDYRIHTQKNWIGRAPHMDICISGDNCISAEEDAFIAYEPKKKFFHFVPGKGRNLMYLNDDVLLSPVQLKPYDILTIGQTKLMFVPLCGERFDWDDK